MSMLNVSRVETSSCLYVETKQGMKWCGDGETEPMENLHLGNGILAPPITEKIDKWLPFHKYASYGKMSNYRPLQSFGLWFPECHGNRISASAIL